MSTAEALIVGWMLLTLFCLLLIRASSGRRGEREPRRLGEDPS